MPLFVCFLGTWRAITEFGFAVAVNTHTHVLQLSMYDYQVLLLLYVYISHDKTAKQKFAQVRVRCSIRPDLHIPTLLERNVKDCVLTLSTAVLRAVRAHDLI